MRAWPPHVEVPGDNADQRDWLRPNIMQRSGDCIGFTEDVAVWRYGFTPDSEAATAYGVSISDGQGFVWVLATRKTGKIREIQRGMAIELPPHFRTVMERD